MHSKHAPVNTKWSLFLEKNSDSDFETISAGFQSIFAEKDIPIVWTPDQYPIKANVAKWMEDLSIKSYQDFYEWSDVNRIDFWNKAIDELKIRFNKPFSSVLSPSENPDNIVWLPDALFNIVESCFSADPEQIAIYFKAENISEIQSISYESLFQSIKQYAMGFRSKGFIAKDRVVLYMPFSIEAVQSYLALIYIGVEPVLIADSFSSVELKKRIEIVQAKAVITCDEYVYADKPINVLSKVLEASPEQIILLSNIIPNVLSIRNDNSDLLLNELKGEFTDDIIPHYHSSTDTISILFSSGTTKEPKALPWTAVTPIKCATDGMLLQDIHEKDVITWTSGMGWMMAPWLIFSSLLNKATIALYSGSTTKKEFIDFTVETKVTVLGTIPSVVKTWKAQQFGKITNWSVRVFSSTGEPSEKEDYLYLMYMNHFKAPVIEYCGGTEIGGAYISSSVLLPNAPSYFNTPAPGGGFILLNPVKKLCSEGESGEVFIIPPSIGLSQRILNKNHYEEYYLDIPAVEGFPMLRKHGDGFVSYFFENIRYYKSMGRTDDSMNLGGIKVSSVELESVINQHPLITESAAISVQEKEGGPEKLIVFVQVKEKDVKKDQLQKELQKILQSQLNPLFKISEIILKESFPRTASNKLMRKDLRKEFLNQQNI